MSKYSRERYQLTSGSSHSFESRNTSESRSWTLHTDIHKSDFNMNHFSYISYHITNAYHMYNALFQLWCILYCFYQKTDDYW